MHNHPVNILHQMPKDKRDKILRYLKCEKGLIARQDCPADRSIKQKSKPGTKYDERALISRIKQ